MKTKLLSSTLLFSFIGWLIGGLTSLAEPHMPLPPWPEAPLQRMDFDHPFWGNPSGAELGELSEGWSGFALRRDSSVSPLLMPSSLNGHPLIGIERGTIRTWFRPY